jgi:hypothetical protein
MKLITILALLKTTIAQDGQCLEGVNKCRSSEDCAAEIECSLCTIQGEQVCYYTPAVECSPLPIPQSPTFGPSCPAADLASGIDLCLFEAASCFAMQNNISCTDAADCSWCAQAQFGTDVATCVYTPQTPCATLGEASQVFGSSCPEVDFIPPCLQSQQKCLNSDDCAAEADCTLCSLPQVGDQCLYTPSVAESCMVADQNITFDSSCPTLAIIPGLGDEAQLIEQSQCLVFALQCNANVNEPTCAGASGCTWCDFSGTFACMSTPADSCTTPDLSGGGEVLTFGPSCPVLPIDLDPQNIADSLGECTTRFFECTSSQNCSDAPSYCTECFGACIYTPTEPCEVQAFGNASLPSSCPDDPTALADGLLEELNITVDSCARGAPRCATNQDSLTCDVAEDCTWCPGSLETYACLYTPAEKCDVAVSFGGADEVISFGPACPAFFECDLVDNAEPCANRTTEASCELDGMCTACKYPPELGFAEVTCIAKATCEVMGLGPSLNTCPSIEDLGIPGIDTAALVCAQGQNICALIGSSSEEECSALPSCSWCTLGDSSLLPNMTTPATCTYTPAVPCSIAGITFSSTCPSAIDCAAKVAECTTNAACDKPDCAKCPLGPIEVCRYSPNVPCTVAGQTFNNKCGVVPDPGDANTTTVTAPSDASAIQNVLAAWVVTTFCLIF